jgi:hypothetical protein
MGTVQPKGKNSRFQCMSTGPSTVPNRGDPSSGGVGVDRVIRPRPGVLIGTQGFF